MYVSYSRRVGRGRNAPRIGVRMSPGAGLFAMIISHPYTWIAFGAYEVLRYFWHCVHHFWVAVL